MSPWELHLSDSTGPVRTYRAVREGSAASRADALQGWAEDSGFRDRFMGTLHDAPFEAFFWETPPWTRSNLEADFEFVLVDAPSMTRLAPDRRSFAEHFQTGAAPVVEFSSLGGDAELIAPVPAEGDLEWAHLAGYTRTAAANDQHALWTTVAQAMKRKLGDTPRWLSTSGLGVHWLHVRIDTRPKYYTHAPYRQLPPNPDP